MDTMTALLREILSGEIYWTPASAGGVIDLNQTSSHVGNPLEGQMSEHVDYLQLASEVEDAALSAHDPEVAASYRRLAASYAALAEFHKQVTSLLVPTETLVGHPQKTEGASFAQFQSRASSYPRATQF